MELQNIILNMETDKVNPETDKVIANTSPSCINNKYITAIANMFPLQNRVVISNQTKAAAAAV